MRGLGDLREDLLSFVSRWQTDLNSPVARSTLQYGVLQKCYTLLDRTIEACTAQALQLTGSFGEETLRLCCKGKPVSRMTLGERVGVLERLDPELARVLPDRARSRRSFVGKSGISLLQSTSRGRNEFAHARVDVDKGQVAEALNQARRFCELNLLPTMLEVQAKGKNETRRAE